MVEEKKVMVFAKKYFIFGEINHFPGQSVFLNSNRPVNCFLRDFCFLWCLVLPKELFFNSATERQFLAHFDHAT